MSSSGSPMRSEPRPRRGRRANWSGCSDHDVAVAPLTVGELRRDLSRFHPQGTIPGMSLEHTPDRVECTVTFAEGDGVRVGALRRYLTLITGRTPGARAHDGMSVYVGERGVISITTDGTFELD